MIALNKSVYNIKSIIASLVIILLAVASILLDYFYFQTNNRIWINIGCSLLASGLVIFLQTVLVNKETVDSMQDWKLSKIYTTRMEKNKDSDPKLESILYKLDGVAFGLKTFRAKQGKVIEDCLRRGVQIRILTMDPNSPFVKQREAEENESRGQIKKTIEDLIRWAKELNLRIANTGDETCGRIKVRGYTCMTLDFYWRMDDEVYFGPYWKGKGSQQTVTYKFEKGGEGFSLYTDYFDELWKSSDNTRLVD